MDLEKLQLLCFSIIRAFISYPFKPRNLQEFSREESIGKQSLVVDYGALLDRNVSACWLYYQVVTGHFKREIATTAFHSG